MTEIKAEERKAELPKPVRYKLVYATSALLARQNQPTSAGFKQAPTIITL